MLCGYCEREGVESCRLIGRQSPEPRETSLLSVTWITVNVLEINMECYEYGAEN